MGKCQSCCVMGSMRPRNAVGVNGAPHPVTRAPFGGAASVTDLCTVGPGTNVPTSLMEDSSTPSETVVPGAIPCSASIRAQLEGAAAPFTEVITWATCSTFAAGEPDAIP